MVNKEYVCSVKKGHLYSGSAPEELPALNPCIAQEKRAKKKKSSGEGDPSSFS